MDFDSIKTGPVQTTDIGIFDHIRDQLEPDAPDWQAHQAFVAECCNKLDSYKSLPHLVRYWFNMTAALQVIATEDPIMMLDIVNHFQAALDRLTEIRTADTTAA